MILLHTKKCIYMCVCVCMQPKLVTHSIYVCAHMCVHINKNFEFLL